MEIIIEDVLISNFIIDLIILSLTSKFTRAKARFIVLCSIFGAGLSLVFPLFALPVIFELICKLLLASILVCISFKFKTFKDFGFIYGVFLCITFIFGGACYAVGYYFKIMPLYAVMLIVLSVAFIIKQIIKMIYVRKSISNFSFDVEILHNGTTCKTSAFLDSGNSLIDPVTNKPVVIVNYKVFNKLYKDIPLENLILKKITDKDVRGAHYVNINTLGKATNMLIFEVDELKINNNKLSNEVKKVCLGLSLSGFERAFSSNMLLSPMLF